MSKVSAILDMIILDSFWPFIYFSVFNRDQLVVVVYA